MIAQRITQPWFQKLTLAMITLYLYGSICIKYIIGAESFEYGVAYTFWDNEKGFADALGGYDPYNIGIVLFGILSIYFSFGNIENAKTL